MLEDLSVFFVDWGEAASLGGLPVRGMFSAGHTESTLGSMGMAASLPRFLLPSADVPDEPVLVLKRGAWFRPFRYQANEAQPDGTGLTTLMLVTHPVQGSVGRAVGAGAREASP